MPPAKPRPNVAFISYRRRDADAVAGRLRDRMSGALPGWTFFMDVASIAPGADFRDAIENALNQSSLFLLLVGRDWLGNDGNRLMEPEDAVAFEIRTALALGLRFIPVLINDAKMPDAAAFPQDIRAAARRNAVELRHSRFEDDFRHLVAVVSGAPDATPASAAPAPAWKTALWGAGTALAGAALGALVGIAGLVVSFQVTRRPIDHWIGDDGAALLLPLLAILGAAAAVALSRRKKA
jgi:hypothetical protein